MIEPVELLIERTEESLLVERRGNLVWKWHKPRPASGWTEWLRPEGWLRQLRSRVEASRTLLLPHPARINPVVWFDERQLCWATPWIEGSPAAADVVVDLKRAMDFVGLGFIVDVHDGNLLVDERLGGLVLIDFQLYDLGFEQYKARRAA